MEAGDTRSPPHINRASLLSRSSSFHGRIHELGPPPPVVSHLDSDSNISPYPRQLSRSHTSPSIPFGHLRTPIAHSSSFNSPGSGWHSPPIYADRSALPSPWDVSSQPLLPPSHSVLLSSSPTPTSSSYDYHNISNSDSDLLRSWQETLLDGLFDRILPVSFAPTVRDSRAKIKWGRHVSDEDRLLVLLRVVKKLGFSSVGHLLHAMFTYRRHPTVDILIGHFLRGADSDRRMHPIAIVDLIWRHSKSGLAEAAKFGFENQPQFQIPQYALPPSLRLKSHTPVMPFESTNQCTRHKLLSWSLNNVVAHLDKRADAILHDVNNGLVRSPINHLTWDTILSFNPTHIQEHLATEFPAAFIIFTTLATNRGARQLLSTEVGSMMEGQDPASSSPHDLDDAMLENEDPYPYELSDSEHVKSTTEATHDAHEHGKPTNMLRDPWLGTTAMLLVLLFFRYKYAIVFPTLIGLFLYTCNTHRDVFTVLGRIGLTISYESVRVLLGILANDADTQLKAWGALLHAGSRQPHFLLLFDNVNKMQRAWQHTLGHSDTLQSGTAATLIQLEDVKDGALRSAPVLENVRAKKRLALTTDELHRDINWAHINAIGIGTILRAWVKHIPGLRKHREKVEAIFRVQHAKHPLRLRKSTIHPMRVTDADESSTVGTASVLRNLVFDQLAILASWLGAWFLFICGDQLSIDRLRKIKLYMAKSSTPQNRHEWVLPIIQLWHLKWNWQKAIVKLHWFKETGSHTFGLHHDADLLQRRNYNPERCDFHPTHHLLEDTFDAHVLDILRLLCEEQTGYSYPRSVHLLDLLESYFSIDGRLDALLYEDIYELAELAYCRYLTTAAGEAALDGAQTYVHWPDATESESDVTVQQMTTESHGLTTTRSHPKRRNVAASKEINTGGGDQLLGTTINFLRVTFWYLALSSAIAEGDIGRVFEIIKLLRFSFWGTNSTNYGNELLELACNFLYEFPADLCDAIFDNYLVNTSGLPGHWIELDLLQEHYNFWIKRLFGEKSYGFNTTHLSEHIALNIKGFSELRDLFPHLFGYARRSGKHTDSSTRNDINELGHHYRQDEVHMFRRGRSHHTVGNEFAAGYDRLASGVCVDFIRRTAHGGSVHGDDVPTVDSTDPVFTEHLPSAPVVVSSAGEMLVEKFVVENE
ncbi:hypothetical protein FISHEDRAFT_46222 [Fistulina hepatica ATCC 64428]|uniref:DUF6589 domain-containing protein n=1 Tax=Fistulina hepatica ATCC 64428 TaxID=1128425 RepID=A0A0D7A9C9_9AGAR|nr:hypothetical protein FISHEDRAFT_46222 [Fistulina hepatica ATCC 64428]